MTDSGLCLYKIYRYKIILKHSMPLTNLTLTSLKYKREMSLDHLKQFLITVLDAKLVMIVSISISSNIPFSMPDANFLLEDM